MPTEVDLTHVRDLVKAERDADAMRQHHEAAAKDATRARDQIRAALAKVFGDADEGVIDGKVVLRKTDTEQFAHARFAKDYPDLAKQFEVPKLKYVIDTDNLRKADPELFAKYATSRWYNCLED